MVEQKLIAALLDRATAKIDELIFDQRRLLKLPKEKRQAVISLAVTRGLYPGVSQFDSLTSEAQRAIALLQERRTALISAAVTGQIDVRGAALI